MLRESLAISFFCYEMILFVVWYTKTLPLPNSPLQVGVDVKGPAVYERMIGIKDHAIHGD